MNYEIRAAIAGTDVRLVDGPAGDRGGASKRGVSSALHRRLLIALRGRSVWPSDFS